MQDGFASLVTMLLAAAIILAAAEQSLAEDKTIVPSGTAEEACVSIRQKSAAGGPLTPIEGDLFLECSLPGIVDEFLIDRRSGFQTMQPPPSLYDLRMFQDIPGVLGNSELHS